MQPCSYHPDVETGVRCVECGKPICPREWISTPVGYKCPEDGRPARGQYQFVKPRQFALALAAGGGAGVLGGLIIGAVGFGGIILGFVWGAATAEAARRGSGGHRGREVAIAASVGILAGWFAGGFVGRVWWLTALIAFVVVLFQIGRAHV